MGLVYTIVMQDDFDWGYVGKNKTICLNDFRESFEKLVGYEPTQLAEWYGHAVFDIEKNCPEYGELKQLVLSKCDSCYYWHDSEPYTKKKLERNNEN